jgi:predicted transcriptional regulator
MPIVFHADVKKLFSNTILDPYTLKDLSLLVCWARQDFINSVSDLRTLQLQKQDTTSKGFFHWWKKTRKIEKALQGVHRDIREKRILLDDLERALEVATNNNYEDMERREFYLDALKEAENNDDTRYEKKLANIEQSIEQMSEKALLEDIRKSLAEVFFSLEKINHQTKRRQEWQLYGPPSSIREEFKKFFAKNDDTSRTS